MLQSDTLECAAIDHGTSRHIGFSHYTRKEEDPTSKFIQDPTMATGVPQNITCTVTGASGNAGSAIVRNLAKHYPNITVRAGFRDLQKARYTESLGRQITPVKLDTKQPDSLDKAFQNANVACIIPPNGENRMEAAIAMMDAAKRSGVQHLVVMYAPMDQLWSDSIMRTEAQPMEVL